jgi:glycosyltransferase involved in cell wall biosynthesis
MKVLVLHSELGVLRGGGENFTKNLFTAFRNRGHHVSAAFVASMRGKLQFDLPAGIEPIPIRGWWSRQLGQAELLSIGSWIPLQSRLKPKWDRARVAICWRTHRWHERRFLRRIEQYFAERWAEFDAVYVHGSSMLASLASQYRPTVLRLPGPVSAELEPVLHKVHAVCANGDALVQIRKFLGDHATEIPIGIDSDVFTPGSTSVRRVLGWKETDYVFGYVGRLIRIKGVDLLATAFRELSRDIPESRLLLVGSGEEEKMIRCVLKNEFLRGMVHIESDVSHQRLAEWYRAMDLLVMPSRYENFSNAILEALACGVPFLASDVGGNRDLAQLGCGFLFEQESSRSLKTCLMEMTQKRDLVNYRGTFGAEYVRGHYSWAASAERLERILTSRLGVEDDRTQASTVL